MEEQIKKLEEQAADTGMSEAEKEERDRLIAEGMGTWLKTDFRKFCASCERHGRKAKVIGDGGGGGGDGDGGVCVCMRL